MRRRILPLLVLAIGCLLLVCAGAVYRMHQSRLDDVRRVAASRAAATIEAEIEDYEQAMIAALEVMVRDVTMRESLAGGRIDDLAREAAPLYERLRARSRVARFSFYSPQRICLLRMHESMAHTDNRGGRGVVGQLTLARSAQTGRPASGVEVTRSGLCLLRVAYPWRDEKGELLGYVALGVPFAAMADEARALTGNDLIFVARQDHFTRLAWERPRAAARRRSAWDQFGGLLVLDSTLASLPPVLAGHLAEAQRDRRQRVVDGDDGRQLLVEALDVDSLRTAGGPAGTLLLVKDITHLSSAMARAMRMVGVACAAVGLLLVGFFHRFLGRVEAQLHARQEALASANARLEERVDQRTREIARRNAEHRAIVAAAIDCVISMDHTGLVTEFNVAAEQTFGYGRDEALGRPLAELIIPPRLRPAHAAGLARFLESGQGARINRRTQVTAMRADGLEFQAEMALTVVRLDDDGPPAFTAYIRDITERLAADDALRQSERRLTRINDCFLDFGADPAENIARLTRACGELLGGDCALYTRLDGKMLHAAGRWNTPPDFQPMDRPQGRFGFDVMRGASTEPVIVRDLPGSAYATSDPNVLLLGLRTCIGQAVFVRGQAVGALGAAWQRDAAPDDTSRKVIGILAVAIGIEEERRAAQAIERERAGLKEAVAGMEQVLGVVAHELRTPLAGLRAMSEFLLTDDARNTAECDAFLKGINEEVVRMAETVNNLLEAARLNSGKARWDFHPLRVRHACEEAIETIRPLLDAASTQIRLDVEPADLEMRGDAGAIRRLIVNLLNNARKHTPRGEIRIAASARTDTTGDWIDLHVADTGAGIPPEVLARLGEPFALNAGVIGINNVNGAGLGFAICKGIVAAHGGEMTVDSIIGQGTTVTIHLRADLAAPVIDPPAAPKAAA